MTTFEDKLRAALTTEANFQCARSDLLITNVLQNGLGSLEDTAVFVSDGGKSALAFAYWGDDEKTIFTAFELGTPTTEETFDGNMWAGRLMEGD